jgi:hypothetical protein
MYLVPKSEAWLAKSERTLQICPQVVQACSLQRAKLPVCGMVNNSRCRVDGRVTRCKEGPKGNISSNQQLLEMGMYLTPAMMIGALRFQKQAMAMNRAVGTISLVVGMLMGVRLEAHVRTRAGGNGGPCLIWHVFGSL